MHKPAAMIDLGVNIDHVATVRQARQTIEPSPLEAATLAIAGGANSITVHLRGDRRHIQDDDVKELREQISVPLNLEMAVGEDILTFALGIKPQQACLVPEKREELTTEGGLALDPSNTEMRECIAALQEQNCLVSLFIEPDAQIIDMAKELGAEAVELHTGAWANAYLDTNLSDDQRSQAITAHLNKLEHAAEHCAAIGIRCHAGHGITYHNIRDIVHLKDLRELNIGHTIVSRSIMTGMQAAVAEMRALMDAGPKS